MRVYLLCAVAAVLATPGYSVPKCDGHWTEYYNVGNPLKSGNDDESLAKIRKLHPTICPNPSNIDVRLVHPLLHGPGNDYWYLGRNHIETKHRSAEFGFLCLGALQKKYYKQKCQDYKVRFCCNYPEPSCPSSYAYWTKWFDRDDPTVTGDYETLKDLRKENPGKICYNPFQVQAQLVTGEPYQVAGEKVTINTHDGFYCRKKDQKDNQCHDYRVRFCCEKEPSCPSKTHQWTNWFDRDNPSVTGDYETLKDLRKENPGKICHNPTNVHATLVTGEPYQYAGEKVTINTHEGFYCKKKDQKDNACHDYRVRFCCPRVIRYWTPWYNVNSPRKGLGDFETLAKIRAAGKKVCQNPLKIQAVRARDHKDALKTGERISAYNTKIGFICINSKQRRTDLYRPPMCSDYKVRFYC